MNHFAVDMLLQFAVDNSGTFLYTTVNRIGRTAAQTSQRSDVVKVWLARTYHLLALLGSEMVGCRTEILDYAAVLKIYTVETRARIPQQIQQSP